MNRPNPAHETNRRYWNQLAQHWQTMRNRDGLWQRCAQEPELAFEGGALELIREVPGGLADKRVCMVGSGDNYVAFALAGLGADVTSVDISQGQLDVAAERASQLGLDINFVQADAADMSVLPDANFDLIVSTNGFFVWIAELKSVFQEMYRLLMPGGQYIFYDIHPFQRPWEDQRELAMAKPYWTTGPFEEDESVEFNWTLADILNPLAEVGFNVKRIIESPAKDARFWEGHEYVPGQDESLLDWQHNPRAGLPVWLTVAVQKPKCV